jgi:D-arabinose 1-dehydrogenase-like Zn-dependent alcohol dehydrogenase
MTGGGGTVWVPLIEQCKPYERVGIVGIGGLGHLAIQFAAKMGLRRRRLLLDRR